MSKRAETRQKFIDALVSSGKSEVTTEDIKKICSKIKVAHPYWFTNEEANRLKRGIFKVPGTMPVSKAQTITSKIILVHFVKVAYRFRPVPKGLKRKWLVH